MNATSLLRYPGGKSRYSTSLARMFLGTTRYFEPFAGGFSVGLAVAAQNPKAEIVACEIDPAVAGFWRCVASNEVRSLAAAVAGHVPTVDDFERRKADGLFDPLSVLVLHRCSFSGRGGGVIGGKDQSGTWKIDARWNGRALAASLLEAHRLLAGRFRLIEGDALVQSEWETHDVYADPPYVVEGPSLYRHSLADVDHERLAERLRTANNFWVLSYDDDPLVRRLYDGFVIHSLGILGGSPSGGSRKKNELVVSNGVLSCDIKMAQFDFG